MSIPNPNPNPTRRGDASASRAVMPSQSPRRIHPGNALVGVGCLSTAPSSSSSSSSYASSTLTSRGSRGLVLSTVNANAIRRNADGGAAGGAVSVGRRGEIGLRRGLHASSVRRHGGIDRPAPGTGIKVTFKDAKGSILKTVEANEGDDILSIAHEYDIDLEGACEGSVACSTCHVILDPQSYDLLPEPSDDENDMLDMAFGLTDTSRLGCQIKVTKELDGITCTLPAATRNMYVDGAKPSH
ncbi:YAH1 [Sanghuangporus vaninii]